MCSTASGLSARLHDPEAAQRASRKIDVDLAAAMQRYYAFANSATSAPSSRGIQEVQLEQGFEFQNRVNEYIAAEGCGPGGTPLPEDQRQPVPPPPPTWQSTPTPRAPQSPTPNYHPCNNTGDCWCPCEVTDRRQAAFGELGKYRGVSHDRQRRCRLASQ